MSLNKVILIGRLGKEPTMRFMPNGEAVCNFSVATSESWKDSNGQKQERSEWHNVTMYRKLAEIAGKYTDKNGAERTAYEIIANEMKMLGGNAQTPAQKPQPAQAQDDISDDVPF